MIIELFGMSRAGKTTQRNRLETELGRGKIGYKSIVRPQVTFESVGGSLERFHLAMYNGLCSAFDEALADKYEVILFDRGFYDRAVLLEIDSEDGSLSSDAINKLRSDLSVRKSFVDFPMLFMVNPEISSDRWEFQKREGKDSSNMNLGLNTRDDVEGLREAFKFYAKCASANPRVKIVNGLDSVGGVTQQILSTLGLL